jgi:hypothetical protein
MDPVAWEQDTRERYNARQAEAAAKAAAKAAAASLHGA